MSTEITVPELGESVVEATVANWLKTEGDSVTVGDAVVELETDKITIEVTAPKSGVISSIKHQEGDDVEIGTVLGMIDESATGDSQATDDGATAEEKSVEQEKPAEQQAEAAGKERATPMAKRLAEEHGVDLSQVQSSNDRISKEDVERHVAQQKSAQKKEEKKKEPQKAPQSSGTSQLPPLVSDSRTEERTRMSRRRQTIAKRLVEAQQTAAMLTTFNEIDMGAVMELRKRRQEAFVKRNDIKLGFMSFFVKASVGALKAFPALNGEIDGNEIVLKNYYDIGMAVGSEEGLVVPVLRDADRLSFAGIEQEIGNLAKQAREGTLSLKDLMGGTFTITNGGVFGSLLSTPILNPPQVGILGLHKIEQRPMAVNGEVVIRPMMYVALSYDHRIVDGREAVQFLVRIKELIEDPEALLLEG